jgi:predicted  nucleic acid-binding Zn-ribbon protein
VTLTCVECSAEFKKRTRLASKYCSEDCRASAKRKLRKLKLKPKCEICGEEFDRKSSRQLICGSPECAETKKATYHQEYRDQNRERLNEEARRHGRAKFLADPEAKRRKDREWRAENRDSLNARRRTPAYRAKAAARVRERNKHPHWRVHNRISSAIKQALEERKAGRKWEALVGYSLTELVQHLERQFLPGMGWHNIGEWHIDHIRPRALFKYTTPDDPEFKDCWAITNLRPLWATDNQQKHAKRVFLL